MPAARKTLITCAVTGNIVRPEQSPHLPITPEQIAVSCLEAAQAGAAQVHIHVRDPVTGAPSMALEHYGEVLRRIRAENGELIVNLTTGPGGRFVPGADDPKIAGAGTTLTVPERRVAHIAALKPDVATLDMNTMNSGPDVVINTPKTVTRMAAILRAAGAVPEIEVFDSGDIQMAKDLMAAGALEGPGVFAIVMGVKYGFQPSPETVLYARNLLPPGAVWTAFGIGAAAFPMAVQSYLAGGHVRIGMEDGVYLSRGVLAPSNAALVAKARRLIEDLGGEIATPAEARDLLGLSGAYTEVCA